jgi:hypothetical protein
MRHVSQQQPLYDFAYSGEITYERDIHHMLESFLKRFGASKTIALMGNTEQKLQNAYEHHANILFLGLLPQQRALERLTQARCAVCYVPNRFPYTIQPALKLREYAALGLRILANEQPCTRDTVTQYGMHVLWGGQDVFADCPDAQEWTDNKHFDASALTWPYQIQKSGVGNFLPLKTNFS